MSHASPLCLCFCPFSAGNAPSPLASSMSAWEPRPPPAPLGRGGWGGEGMGGRGGGVSLLLPPLGLNLSCSLAFRASGYSIHHTAFEIVVCWHVSLSGCVSWGQEVRWGEGAQGEDRSCGSQALGAQDPFTLWRITEGLQEVFVYFVGKYPLTSTTLDI